MEVNIPAPWSIWVYIHVTYTPGIYGSAGGVSLRGGREGGLRGGLRGEQGAHWALTRTEDHLTRYHLFNGLINSG